MAGLTVMYDKNDHIPMVLTQEHIDKMKSCISGELHWCGSEDICVARGYDEEILFLWGGTGNPPERYISQSKTLRWVHTFSAGVDALAKSEELKKREILVTNAKGIHGPVMGLTTLGYIISFLRRFPELFRAQQRHEWFRNFAAPPTTGTGKVLCVVGAGAIGTDVARLCKGIGMYTIGVKRTPCPIEGFDEVLPNTQLDLGLERADFVVVATPGSKETFHLIDARRLSHMKSTGILINIGRGPVVDQAALIDALQKGMIGGAALDTTEDEPLPQNNPLWDMPNVILTPHTSAVNDHYLDMAVDQFCDLLRLYEAKKPLYNTIRLDE